MDLFDIAEFRTKLRQFLNRFQSCAADKRARDYFRMYTTGLISNLPRKNCETIALQANVPVRSVQWFLSKQVWDHQQMRNKLQNLGIQFTPAPLKFKSEIHTENFVKSRVALICNTLQLNELRVI